jgi:hypothetical protein
MVWLVIGLNGTIVWGCGWMVGQLWQARQRLIALRLELDRVERNCYRNLHWSPESVVAGQQGTGHLRQQYQTQGQRLQNSLARIQRILALVQWGLSLL